MPIRVIILLFLSIGCGKEVVISNQLEKMTSITETDSQLVSQQGIIIKEAGSVVIKIQSKTYSISKFSSHQADKYIDELPEGSSDVKFEGVIKVDEVILKKFY
jgi:hypothetical protein